MLNVVCLSRARLLRVVIGLSVTVIGLSGCMGFFATETVSTEPTPTPTRIYAPVPTYTPTMVMTPSATPLPSPTALPVAAAVAPTQLTTTATLSASVATVIPAVDPLSSTLVLTSTPTTALSAAPTVPLLTISADVANVRSGPGTTFALVASVLKGERYQPTGQTRAGDWWQLCCINEQSGWVYAELVAVEGADSVAIIDAVPTVDQATPAPAAVVAATPTSESVPPTPAPPPAAADSSAGDFNPATQYQIVQFKVLGLNENNGGIRDSRAQHHIFLTVLDQSGNGLDGVVVENLVGEKGQFVTGSKGPGKVEITMYYEPFKLRVASDPSGTVTSQTSNQMGLAFPHLPDIVGKLGGLDYEYAVCPTLEINCSWPIQAVHFSYEITFQKVR